MLFRLYALVVFLLVVPLASAGTLPKTGGDHQTVKISVEGRGRTSEEAKQSAFRQAIEQVVGSILVSDTESSNARLVKDNIGNYSSGYVDNYEIIDSYQDRNGFVIHANVTVASSKIAQRMLARGEKSTITNGEQLQAQLESALYERQQGDALLMQVLGSYPHNAYTVNSGQTEITIGRSRQPYISIPFQIRMSDQWLTAFSEALSTMSAGERSCGQFVNVVSQSFKNVRNSATVNELADRPCGASPDVRINHKNTVRSYYLHDNQSLAVVNSALLPTSGLPRIGLRLDLLDASGETLDSRCADITTDAFIRFNSPNGVVNMSHYQDIMRPEIAGQSSTTGTLSVDLNRPGLLGEVAKIKMEIQGACT